MKKYNVKIVVRFIIGIVAFSVCIQQLEYCRAKKNIKDFGLHKEYDNISVAKTFEGKLSKEKEEEIINTIIKYMGGRIIHNQESSEGRKIYAYTPVLKNIIRYNKEEININIIITYMEDLNVSNVYIGFPIVNIDY